MKQLIYLAILAFFPSSFVLANHGERGLEGHWYSPSEKREIRIDKRHYGLRVRGLPGDNRFERIGNRVFRNRDGTRIRVERNGVIAVEEKRRHRWRNRYKVAVRHYYKEGFGASGDHHHRKDGYRDRSLQGYGSSDEWRYRGNDYGGSRRDGYNDYGSSSREKRRIKELIIGTWQTRGLDRNKRVEIQSTSEGIQAKFKSSSRSTFFAQSSDEPNRFRDNKGNTYVLEAQGKLLWIGTDGKRFELIR